jgi:hypothetical protein
MEHTRDMDITLNIDKVMIIITDYCWNYTSLWILGIIPLESIHKTVAIEKTQHRQDRLLFKSLLWFIFAMALGELGILP